MASRRAVPAPVTLGIDLAASARRTSVCRVDWSVPGGDITFLADRGDDALCAAIAEADKTGLDCPIGWPEAFVRLVSAHHAGAPLVAAHPYPDRDERRSGLDPLRYRLTDDLVWRRYGTRPPLSVSTDLLGVVALRAVRLLDTVARKAGAEAVRRDGAGAVAEVYPAAALRHWQVPGVPGYKAAEGAAARAQVVAFLASQTGLVPDADVEARCVDSHDDLDALVCAVLARAVSAGLTREPATDTERARACVEGWIHMPVGALRDVAARQA